MKSWLQEIRPDHIVIVYNDHLNHFTFDAYPTFAAGVAAVFPQADEGWGPRALPDLRGDPQFGWHMCTELVAREFDLTVCQEMRLDHGIYSWIPYIADLPRAVPVFPIAVNMLRLPNASARALAQTRCTVAIREAVHAYGEGRVVVMRRRHVAPDLGDTLRMANEEMDRWFLQRLGTDLEGLVEISQWGAHWCGGHRCRGAHYVVRDARGFATGGPASLRLLHVSADHGLRCCRLQSARGES